MLARNSFQTFVQYFLIYIRINRDGILAISCDSSRMQPIPANSRNVIVSVSLQYRKTSRMDTKSHETPRIIKYINSWRFVGVRVVVCYGHYTDMYQSLKCVSSDTLRRPALKLFIHAKDNYSLNANIHTAFCCLYLHSLRLATRLMKNVPFY